MSVDIGDNGVGNKGSSQTDIEDSVSELCDCLIIYLLDVMGKLVH